MSNENVPIEIIFGLVDENNVLINTVVVAENNLSILEILLEEHNAVAYYPLDQQLYLIRVNEMYWTGTHWDLLKNKS